MAVLEEKNCKHAFTCKAFESMNYEEVLDHSKIESLLSSLERYSNKLDKLLTKTSSIEEQILTKGK